MAAEYLLNEIPSDAEIEHDLLQGVDRLGQIYRAADEGLYVPVDSPDKSADGAAAYRGVLTAFTIFTPVRRGLPFWIVVLRPVAFYAVSTSTGFFLRWVNRLRCHFFPCFDEADLFAVALIAITLRRAVDPFSVRMTCCR